MFDPAEILTAIWDAVPNELIYLLIAIFAGLAFLKLLLLRRSAARSKFDFRNLQDQHKAIETYPLTVKTLINKECFDHVFAHVENKLQAGAKYRLFAEVSVGAFLTTKNPKHLKDVYGAYGSKRVDMLIVDSHQMPVVVIEYHGTGHFQGNSRERDAVKRAAFANAGLPLLEVYPNTGNQELSNMIDQVLRDHEDHETTAMAS
ncbi:hypothetical protein GCM10008927_07870 [Amylibacter ulvae]|uniref:DUF2726 domain-containing protein n=1 Tax=Paramylibacter ulvae TaxID=1651968 RepID=A0ABQ3CV30_9RHOB|nr:DUF2726 domain-containing protein [Amylibacter ulvae]GHA45329.1 hypothetical protein GCM10008927_07870 [Amylibacter ulvae]